MGILDDYQAENEAEEAESAATADPNESRRKRTDLNQQIAILDSDLKKTNREIEDIEIQKRKLKKDEERIRIERDGLDKIAKKMENDRMRLEDELHLLKKKLKVLK